MNSLPSLLHITDPHLFADVSAELRGTRTFETLERTLNRAQQADRLPDLIALTGDLVQDDSATAYDHFRPLLEPFGVPVLCLPGNHDNRDFMRDRMSDPPFSYCGVMYSSGWQFIGIDSCVEGSAGGRVRAAELARLDNLLSARSAEHVVICLHHPPVSVDSAWLDSVGLQNRDQFLSVVARHSHVRVVLFGHVHQEVEVTESGVLILGTPSTCSQFRRGSDSFAVDDKPPAFRRLQLNDDGGVESELVWVD